MYLIVNTSRKMVAISDLGITLESNQLMDLDQIKLPIKPEESQDLQKCIKYGLIRLMKTNRKEYVEKTEEDVIVNENEVKDEIKQIIREELKEFKVPQNGNNSSEMIEMMKEMMNIISSGNIKSKNINDEEDVDLDDNILSKIHEKAVNKIAKNSVSKVDYNIKKVKDKSISNNASELGNLLD